MQGVGKEGGLGIDTSDFCKFPDLQRPVLEKRAGCQMVFQARLEQLFHFSCLNYGDYCLCFYIYFLFPTTRRARLEGAIWLRATVVAE